MPVIASAEFKQIAIETDKSPVETAIADIANQLTNAIADSNERYASTTESVRKKFDDDLSKYVFEDVNKLSA